LVEFYHISYSNFFVSGLKSNRATTNPPLKSSDFLQETDKKVKEIIKQILQAQKEAGDCGVSIKVAQR
jgi:hypothetical protein